MTSSAGAVIRPPQPALENRLSAVGAENRLIGAPRWLGPLASDRAIEVYASTNDVAPGGTVSVHVSTSPAASYRIVVYRLGWYGGVGARRMACLPSCSGSRRGTTEAMPSPEPTGRILAGWPNTDTVTIGRGWVSGYYLVRALLLNGPQSGRSATTYVVVNARRRDSKILIQ
ncbi:MAG TPA: N,N-dimethylformamidase beta subunit family domain-containing protein, partial [Gaiella sp.]|nr:N,N-dimethylformamidase beta subunit family domain-containing protein [Gaiella sp.]